MRASTRLVAFAAGLVVVAAASYAVGSAVGPLDSDRPAGSPHSAAHSAAPEAQPHSGGHAGDRPAAPAAVGGLTADDGRYALVPDRTRLPVGTSRFRFVVEAAEGGPLTEYDATHERELHLVVVRRDLTRFQHLHPTRTVDGAWEVPLRLDAPGPYRVFADFAPAGEPVRALAVDVTVPGAYRPEPRPVGEQRLARGGGYEVGVAGVLRAGSESSLSFEVRRGDDAVRDLDPYLGALGHLVVLRESDLAYLHVHPEDGLAFRTTVPTAGGYGAFLQTSHRGAVRTAAIRLEATS